MTKTTNQNASHFDYLVITPSIAASGNQTIQLVMDQDSYFQLEQWSIRTSADAVGDIEPNNCSVQIQDQATGRMMSNQPMPQNIIAPREYPRQFSPIVFVPGTILQFYFVNSTAGAITITMALHGTKLFSFRT